MFKKTMSMFCFFALLFFIVAPVMAGGLSANCATQLSTLSVPLSVQTVQTYAVPVVQNVQTVQTYAAPVVQVQSTPVCTVGVQAVQTYAVPVVQQVQQVQRVVKVQQVQQVQQKVVQVQAANAYNYGGVNVQSSSRGRVNVRSNRFGTTVRVRN